MFGRKKIKALKENLKVVNEQRMQLRNENIIYQKELNALKEMIYEFRATIESNNELIKQSLKKPTTKKVKKDE